MTGFGLETRHYAEPIGFIGLGAMGGPIVGHLLRQGHAVVVHDLNVEAVLAAEQAGARVAPDPVSVAQQAKLIFVCLPSLEALRAVLLGATGIARCEGAHVVVDLSTTGPAFAREIRAKLDTYGVMYLDAPITGNVTTAGNGKLGVMCSGSAQAYAVANPALAVIANSTVLYLGDASGRAQTLKLLNNLNSASGMAVSCEAFIVGTKAGLRPRTMLQVINAGEASTNASRNKFGPSVLPRRFNYGARMAITAKDISFMVAEADRLDVPVWIAKPVQQLWRFAVSQGGGDRDGSSLITYLEPWAGIEVRDMDDTHDASLSPGPDAKTPECQILCEPEYGAVLASRLNAMGDDDVSIATLAEALTPAHCKIRVVEPGTDVAELCDALGAPRSEGELIINTCWLPAHKAEKLSHCLRALGWRFVDAPAAGRVNDIGEGTGSIIVSGIRDEVATALPLLQKLGKQVFHVSERPGDAQRMRQLDEAIAAVLMAVACEAYIVGARAGLAPEIMPQILGIETGRTLASATLFPQQVMTRRFNHGRRLGTALRALTLVCDDAARLGISPLVLDSARLLYGIAISQLGENVDFTKLVCLSEQWTGVKICAGVPVNAMPVNVMAGNNT
ncbi:NAD(P)-dependent oxidoreductase [Candidimonas sp. SYP-B2681]|uniref:NAD(P)-binding domain-containing protein n=1 Tax=Candidimonas sp. SYP-B2681 TaxID=2497686 RepID=UPI000F875ACC|nr:NAD(P)-binding domain-containing protein [Candidimonas sp. SYP-B2681]RTZ45471.1 NAD(P)-dependent oxidoreductase [Candidimonas sp. SYP-B2681]